MKLLPFDCRKCPIMTRREMGHARNAGKPMEKTALSLSRLENTVEIGYALLDYRNPQSREYMYSLVKSG
ncbi:MAG: hypothetical protein H6559_32115 [Lewinellaceae bacterium]|nr:hypothetical protein [Lewinellaceae bacterium]